MIRRVLAVLLTVLALAGTASVISAQEAFTRITGEGSSLAGVAIDQARRQVAKDGIVVDYNPSGSSAGRRSWLNGTVDFAASDLPFQFDPEDGSEPERPEADTYGYVPIAASGVAFAYNLKIDRRKVTNLRLSGENVARIFTGAITRWNDPALVADNPGLQLPDRPIIPVVRSDGSGATARLTDWMVARHPGIWGDYCTRSGRAPACGPTSYYPTGPLPGMIAQSGDLGVAGYVKQGFAEGAIGYVAYPYAIGNQLPVAKVLNEAGYYTAPTPPNVAVSLLRADVDDDEDSPDYLTQELGAVYTDDDPRTYELSGYTYLIVPTRLHGQFDESKGRTLGAFGSYLLCDAQQDAAELGLAPLPVNLVEHGLEQLRRIPGAVVPAIDLSTCNNPTFSPDGSDRFATEVPLPPDCDRQGPTQCPLDGTSTTTTSTSSVTTPSTTSSTTGDPTSSTVPSSGGTGSGSTGGGALPRSLPASGPSQDPTELLFWACVLVLVGRITWSGAVARRQRATHVSDAG